MKTNLKWTSGMHFTADCDGNSVEMDSKAPLGKNQGMTPKELVATGLGGCTVMDVIALLKKHKQPFETIDVNVDVTPSSDGHPIVFKSIEIEFHAKGNIDKNILLESVKLSQTKYCGVSAMLSKSVPIHYSVFLNDERIGEGSAQFA